MTERINPNQFNTKITSEGGKITFDRHSPLGTLEQQAAARKELAIKRAGFDDDMALQVPPGKDNKKDVLGLDQVDYLGTLERQAAARKELAIKRAGFDDDMALQVPPGKTKPEGSIFKRRK